jgi:aconitate hydratase
MDSRSIAATAINGGRLTGADAIDYDEHVPEYIFEDSVYEKRVYMGYGRARHEEKLIFGPNIKDWPQMEPLREDMVLKLASVIKDSVTTTDELIPSGETSAYRSNPLGLAEFALSRKDPEYVSRAKSIQAGKDAILSEIGIPLDSDVSVGSAIYANKPGDGSAREQAASVQKVLGGFANICIEYATKRYRSNLINWGILPFRIDESDKDQFCVGDVIYIKEIRQAVGCGDVRIPAELFRQGKKLSDLMLIIDPMTDDEKKIIQDGCLINFYRNGR